MTKILISRYPQRFSHIVIHILFESCPDHCERFPADKEIGVSTRVPSSSGFCVTLLISQRSVLIFFNWRFFFYIFVCVNVHCYGTAPINIFCVAVVFDFGY